MNYGYEVLVKETYQRDPSCWCHVNYSLSRQYEELNQVFDAIKHDAADINKRYRVIKHWTKNEGSSVVYKIMFEKIGTVGRLIRSFTIKKNKKPDFSINDSLI